MIMKKLALIISSSLLLSQSISMANANQVFRCVDDNGVKTLSKTLPPHAAQKGYEILDDSSLRVLEKVTPAPTDAEIAEIERQQAAKKEQQRLAEIAAKQEQERQRRANVYDANLLANFRSEAELHEKREIELHYFQNQIKQVEATLKRNQDKLYQFQKQAAQVELNGRAVAGNLKKRLIAAEQEIEINKTELQRLADQNIATQQQYDKDLIRLKELLALDEQPTEDKGA